MNPGGGIGHAGGSGDPKLSVVLITWRMRDLLERMLESFHRHAPAVPLEIICVDNASQDGTVEMIQSRFPQVKLLRNDQNRGVAPARNQALRIARGEYVAILDADMEFVEDALGPLLAALEADPSIGMAGCRLTFPDGTTQFNAKRFPSPLALLARRLSIVRALGGMGALARHEMHEWDRTDSRDVDYLIGACQVVRRTVFEKIGLLDERIFYGPEDIDFCYRTRLAGWRIRWIHSVRIVHHEQRTTKRRPFSKVSLRHYQAIAYFFRKHGLRYAAKLGGASASPA